MVAGELGHYKELLGILHDQVENVTVETGEAVLDILTRLNEIDQLIQDMIAFLNQAGTSETIADDGSDRAPAGDEPPAPG